VASIRSLRSAIACAGLFLLAPSVYPANRPLPEDVTVKAFARRESDRLELLVRVPLTAVKDIQFPTRRDGYLDLNAILSMLPGASRYWIADCFEVYENGVVVPRPEIAKTRISVNSDQSFDSYQDALAHFDASGLPPASNVLSDQIWLDVSFKYPLRSLRSVIAIQPKLAGLGLRVSTVMNYMEPDGGIRVFSFEGDPGLIYLDARWQDATKQFLPWGFRFPLSAADFLLFIFCLVLPLRRYWQICTAITAFVAALSVTFLASAFGLTPDAIWFHPLIDTLSAVFILLAAFANIIGHATLRRRALLALGAGFVYGFRCLFDFTAKAQFGGSHPVISAAAFNAGMVFAVVVTTALLTPLLSFMFSFAKAERVEMIVVSALAADTAWGWLEERWAQLSRVPLQVPVFNVNLLVLILRCLTVLVLLGGLLWFADGWLKSHHFPSEELSPKDKARTAT
jgi:hypothetical protein